jgi:hypothetical protein
MQAGKFVLPKLLPGVEKWLMRTGATERALMHRMVQSLSVYAQRFSRMPRPASASGPRPLYAQYYKSTVRFRLFFTVRKSNILFWHR